MPALTDGISFIARMQARANALIKPILIPVRFRYSSLYFLRKSTSEDMSTSWNVDRDAAVFCACFRRSAVLRRMRFILTYIRTTLAAPISKIFGGPRLTRRSSRFPEKPPSFLGVSTSLGGSGFWGCRFGGGGGGVGGGAGFVSLGGSGVFSSCFGGCDSCEGVSLGSGSFGSSFASSFFPADGSPPASSSASSWPTDTVSSSLTNSFLIVPASGALTATSI